jgi:hypothetical protein
VLSMRDGWSMTATGTAAIRSPTYCSDQALFSKRSVATLRIYDCAQTQFLATDDQGINLLAFACGSCVVR